MTKQIEKLTELQASLGYKFNGEINPVALLGLFGESAEVLHETILMKKGQGKFLYGDQLAAAASVGAIIDNIKKKIRKKKDLELEVFIDPDRIDAFDLELADTLYYLNILATNRGKTLEDYAELAYNKVQAKLEQKVKPENVILIYPEKWSDNITLIGVDGNTSDWENLEAIFLKFNFYDCKYNLAVSKKDLEQDYANFNLDGDARLFESFNYLMEEDFWEKIKETFIKYQKYMAQLEDFYSAKPIDFDNTKHKKVYWIEYFKDEDTGELFPIERYRLENIDYELSEFESETSFKEKQD